MGLFNSAVRAKIDSVAAKSNEKIEKPVSSSTRSMNDELDRISKEVLEYFKDSPAILITSKKQLHSYIDDCIEYGYAGIDTETTGLDRIHDHVVGASLYVPGRPECYIPTKHIVPIFDTPYRDQLTYEEIGEEFGRLVIGKVKLIFANADFDLAMIYKDFKVDLIDAFYYDVISAWRCLREDELDNALKVLYAKYVLRGKADPKKFSDFFSPKLFPYCKPDIAKLYAANDAKITFDLFVWQLPYLTPDNPKCIKNNLQKIANLVWNIEFPMVKVCALLHRRGVYLDDSIAVTLHDRYTTLLHRDEAVLAEEVQKLIDEKDVASNRNRPFRTGKDFNCNSNPHVKYLLNKLLGSEAKTTGKEVLKEINKPSTKAILNVRGDVKLLSTYVDKLPKSTASDHRVHACFKALGAATGRMCIEENTYIHTVNRREVRIKDIVPGDTVFCYDENTDKIVQAPVLNKWKTGENKKCVTIKYIRKSDKGPYWLTCTPEHLIYTKNKGWIEARLLKKGDELLSAGFITQLNSTEKEYYHTEDDNLMQYLERVVHSVHIDVKRHDVYDIEVEGYHNFFAANILVHNSSDSPNMQNIPSHALDIRHLFRATPEQTEIIKLAETDTNIVELTLSIYDSVPTPEGQLKIKDAKENTKVILKEDKTEVIYSVSSINVTDDKAKIVLRKEMSS